MASLTKEKRLKAQLEAWRKALINLTRANRLLYLKPGSVLEIAEPGPDEVYARLAAALEVVEPRDPDPFPDEPPRRLRPGQVRFGPITRSTAAARLRSLDRTATQAFLDRGLWTLYFGFGLLEWDDAPPNTGAPERVYSPLLLVPVTAKRDSPAEPFKIRRADEEQRFNPALFAKIEDEFGITLQLPGDDEDLEPREVFESVARQVSGKAWRVHPRVVLSTFTFHKEPILRDLATNEELVLANKIVEGLAIGAGAGVSFEFEPIDEAKIDREAPPEKVVTILDADASQRRAIAAAIAGKSFVMDGPPGTGKSQTIANMIADLLTRQKSVLFVSEKAAALDVVHARLKTAGLSEFVLELHSHKARRKEVARELGKSLLIRVRAGGSMAEAERERLRRKREQLNDYVVALNEQRRPLGQSLHQVIGRIAQLQGLPQAPPPALGVQELDHARWAEIIEFADALGRAWGPITRPDRFLWRELAPSDWDAARRVRLLGVLESAGARLAELVEIARDAGTRMCLPLPASTPQAEQYHAVENLLQRREFVHAPWLSGFNDQELRDRLVAARNMAASLDELEARLDHDPGLRWRDLPSDGPKSLFAAVARARANTLRPVIDDATTSVSLETQRETLSQVISVLEECAEYVNVLATTFDLTAGAISFSRALELARLAGLADASDLPEPDWFAPVGRKKAQEAITWLGPLLGRVNAMNGALRGLFKREVLLLDLETLCLRFQSTYRSLFRWFNPDYRRDRRALRSVTRSGRVRREELVRLPEALKWQRAVNAFAAAGAATEKTLGHFFRGEATDLGAAKRAVRNAEAACELAGTEIGPETLAKRLAHGAELGPGVGRSAVCILDLAARWDVLGVVATQLRTLPLKDAIQLAHGCDSVLLRLIEALRAVDEAATRPASLYDAKKWLLRRQEVENIERAFRDNSAADAAAFGAVWNGRATKWDRLDSGLAWAGAVKAALGGAVSPETGTRLATMSVDAPALRLPLKKWAGSIRTLATQFQEQRAKEVGQQLHGPFEDAQALLSLLSSTIDDVGEWHAHVRAIAGLVGQGLDEATKFCLDKRVAAVHVRGILERALCEAWADDVLRSDLRLADFRADDRDALVTDFRRLDREFIRLAAREAIAACSERRPANLQGAAGIIRNEAEKQKRHMPVRDLLGRTREVVQSIKPCFMMSPLSVSQFLPPDMVFDVVIFDEASQVRPADAISSIYRAKQLVVAGDQKQLPPTSFFERMDVDDDETWDENEPDQFESVLDKCKGAGIFTSLPLRWHYRSQHEHLIAYSNQGFYDGRLVTFPGALGEAPDLGVEVFTCPAGVYRRGGQRDNPQEANLVGERVVFHVRMHPSLSIGVVAFSEAQAAAIDAVIERLACEHTALAALRAEDRLNGLFVKNLETVQGDERDIIIFSMGYGRDEAGKFTMNFGPLSRSGGERRLNVAITRARRKVEFVTSVRASDFSADLGTDGARHLKRYLEYAERRENRLAVLAIPLEPGGGDFESPFEAEVARTIRAWGYDVIPQVGCSDYRIDLGVRSADHGGRFVLGVECDGAMYHSSRAARDRDRLRQEILERLGWRLHRIWGPSWYRHRCEQEQRLHKAIDDAIRDGQIPQPAAPPANSAEEPGTDVVRWDAESRPSWATTYSLASIPDAPSGLQLMDVRARELLQRMIVAIIAEEGPVHRARLLRRVRSAFGVARAGARIQKAFDAALRRIKAADDRVKERDHFLWIWDTKLRVRVPRGGDLRTRRSIEEVAPWELEHAINRTVDDALRIDRSSVMTYVARLYGWDRNGGRIEAAFHAAFGTLVRRGDLVADGEWLLPPPEDDEQEEACLWDED